jgi:hypothetical protein
MPMLLPEQMIHWYNIVSIQTQPYPLKKEGFQNFLQILKEIWRDWRTNHKNVDENEIKYALKEK